MPMFLALNIWMTVSRRMVADWSRLELQALRPLSAPNARKLR